MPARNKAIMQLLLCSALWSMGGIFIKLIPWNPLVIAGFRGLLSGSVIFVYMRVTKQRLALNRRSLPGGVALWLTMTFFVSANKLTTAANAIVLQFVSPIFVVLISVLFLKKRPARADIIAALLTMAGISLFFFDELSSGGILGNIIALGSGFTFACYYISLGVSAENERLSAVLVANALVFLAGLPFAFTTAPEVSFHSVLYIIILGLFQQGLPFVLLSVGSGHCPPLACALLGALEPLLNPLWVFLFDGEAPGLFALFGGLVVIATVTLWCVFGNREKDIAKADGA